MGISSPFLDLLAGRPAAMQLDEAALEIAALDHQPVDRQACLDLLSQWAAAIQRDLPEAAPGPAFLSRLNQVFFGELKFAGDRDDYNNPANSCLDLVLARRKGLPITLAVVYMELARRVGRTIEGIAYPAHFLCRFVEDGIPIYIDVFHEGRLMTEEDCVDLIASALGQSVEFNPAEFPPATSRVILHRMLNNLKNSYARSGRLDDFQRLEELQRNSLHDG